MKRAYLFLLIVLLAACKGAVDVDGEIKYAHLNYSQTYCADPWTYGASDKETIANAKRYLDSLGALSIDISLRADSPTEFCNSCSCRTGKVFHAFSNENSVPQFMALGFTRE